MNRNTLLIIVGIVAILAVGFWLFRMVSGSSPKEEITPTPTPSPVFQEIDENVQAELQMKASGKDVTLTVSGLDGNYKGLEYELSYMTDDGPEGAIGSEGRNKPIPLTSGQDEFTRDIKLGTCSTGGKCTYHLNPHDFSIVTKFYDADDKVFVLRKEFEEV